MPEAIQRLERSVVDSLVEAAVSARLPPKRIGADARCDVDALKAWLASEAHRPLRLATPRSSGCRRIGRSRAARAATAAVVLYPMIAMQRSVPSDGPPSCSRSSPLRTGVATSHLQSQNPSHAAFVSRDRL